MLASNEFAWPASATLRTLPIAPEEALALGGFDAAHPPDLIDPHAKRGAHATWAVGTVLGAALCCLLVLIPGCRWLFGVAAVLAFASAWLDDANAAVTSRLLGASAIGAALWAMARIANAPWLTFACTAAVSVALGALVWAGARGVRAYRRRTLGFVRLARLHAEVHRFNELVRTLDVADQLEDIRHPGVAWSQRAEVLAGLCQARGALVRALRIERILRESGPIAARMGALATGDLVPLEAERMGVAAEGASELLRETLEIAAGARAEIDRLQHRS